MGRAVALATLLFCGAAPAGAGDLDELLDLLEGDFDNRQQYEAQFDEASSAVAEAEQRRSESGASPSDGSEGEPLFSHLGLQRRRVDLPFLGEYVIYAQITRRADPDDVYRQNLQVFRQDEDGAIRARIHGFRDSEGLRDILQRPAAFATLTAADVVAALPEACDPRWQNKAGVWVSRVDRQHCVITSRRDGKPRHIQSTEFVENDLVRNEESGYKPDGTMIFGLPPDTYYRYERVPVSSGQRGTP